MTRSRVYQCVWRVPLQTERLSEDLDLTVALRTDSGIDHIKSLATLLVQIMQTCLQ
jgi:hypothetical protein